MSDTSAATLAYLEQNGVHANVRRAVAMVLRERPADPIKAISDHLLARARAKALLIVAHNFQREGAQLVAACTARLLNAEICAPVDGPLREDLERDGIPTLVVSVDDIVSLASERLLLVHTAMLWELVSKLVDREARFGWCIHESDLPVLFAQLTGFEDALRSDHLLDRAPCVFVCDAQLREYAPMRSPAATSPFKRIYNGIDITAFDALCAPVVRADVRAELGVTTDQVLCVTVGTPKPRKGQLGVVHAATELGWCCAVVGARGEGEYEATLQAQSSCKLIGRGDAALVAKFMVAADVYVCNSEIESFPLGILEAMACSLPVVSTDCGGIREQLSTACGILVPMEASTRLENLVSALRPLADAEVRRGMGSAARSRVEELFGLATMRQAYEEFMGSL